MMGFLHNHIKHVIYIVKENRTYDQILGDLGNGGNPRSASARGKRTEPDFREGLG
ncbi:hypothetical protein [Paraburkholderia sp. SIMBA_030]|uniref:hypothetical protein n=1 Tax=Paraburkholderia sp. SIMBA_030 TaxID=3085773 RepID=UPI00397B4D44